MIAQTPSSKLAARLCAPSSSAVLLLVVLAIAAAVTHRESSDQGGEDGETGRETDFWTCDRECRWRFDFYDRRVRGKTVGLFKRTCVCWRGTQQLGHVPYRFTEAPFLGPPPLSNMYANAREFDPDFWADRYTTPFLCAVDLRVAPPIPRTFDAGCSPGDCKAGKAKLEAHGLTVLHCGRCGACSSPEDIKVLFDTRETITAHTTECSTKFKISNTIGLRAQKLGELKQCLRQAGITFSDDGRAWEEPVGKPTCFDCWTDNIMNDAQLCWNHCLGKFVKSGNAGHFAKDPCLQCDEYTSGPAFIACAGANRRSAGIKSDIDRGDLVGTKWEQKICTVGICSSQGNATSPCAAPLPWREY
uniref:Uncharacterized protein n=1 Tax=Calcidiscus leptoporus TaxID=127549 RepID=A0A7S0JGM0_9EUKA